MANTNQNQNLNKLLDQSLQKKNSMEQGLGISGNQVPAMPNTPKAKKANSGLLIKIILAVLFLFIIGIGALGYFVYADIDSKNTNQSDEIKKNQGLINILIDKVDVIENNLSGVDTFSQKVEAIEEELNNYSTKEDLLPVMEFLKKQDTDQDGLSDYDEIVLYKSNPNKKDSDNDGFSDKEEVDSGYNPAGPGKLGEQELSQNEIDVIVGDWSGNLSSEVTKSLELDMNLSDENKVTGSFMFPGSDQNISYNSRVTGSYTYDMETNSFNAILVNYFSIKDSSASEDEKVAEKQYKMNMVGTFSNETKQINGNWNIDGTTPNNWPAASGGIFAINKAQEQATTTLEEDTTEETTESVIPAQTVSVKAFSFGFSPSTIKLTKDQRVTLELTSLDVAHTFTVDELGIDMKVQGGETTSIEFNPKELGEFEFYCSIPGHKEAGMVGTIMIEEPAK